MVPSSSEDTTCTMRAGTAEATFSKLPEMQWRERHFLCLDFVS